MKIRFNHAKPNESCGSVQLDEWHEPLSIIPYSDSNDCNRTNFMVKTDSISISTQECSSRCIIYDVEFVMVAKWIEDDDGNPTDVLELEIQRII